MAAEDAPAERKWAEGRRLVGTFLRFAARHDLPPHRRFAGEAGLETFIGGAMAGRVLVRPYLACAAELEDNHRVHSHDDTTREMVSAARRAVEYGSDPHGIWCDLCDDFLSASPGGRCAKLHKCDACGEPVPDRSLCCLRKYGLWKTTLRDRARAVDAVDPDVVDPEWLRARGRVEEVLASLLHSNSAAFESDGFTSGEPGVVAETLNGTFPARARLLAFVRNEISVARCSGASVADWKEERYASYVLEYGSTQTDGVWCIDCAERLNTVRGGRCPTCAELATARKFPADKK